VTVPRDLISLAKSFDRHLAAENMSPRTRHAYRYSIDRFEAFLDTLPALPTYDTDGDLVLPAGPRRTAELTKDHFIAWIIQMQAITVVRRGRTQPLASATVSHRYRCLQSFIKYLVDEGVFDTNPLANLKAPQVDELPVPILTEDRQRALVETCGKGKNRPFIDVRDEAIIRLLIDAGGRRREVSNLEVDDLDFEYDVVGVLRKAGRKGTKHSALPFGTRTARALDRYLRVRADHRLAARPELWLAAKGPLTHGGLYQMIRRRGTKIGIEGLHPHQLRHTFAHEFLAAGGSENDLMRLAGWSSRSMLNRYGAAAADDRARASHRLHSPGDKI
jgi:site-specific recombinase XerD